MLLLAGNPLLDLAQQVISGAASGMIFASLALALVLIYRAMDVANFAQGEMAMFATFVCFSLITELHLSYAIAFVLTVVIAFAGGFVVERVVIRPFEGATVLSLVIVTLGLSLIFNGTAGFLYGYVSKSMPSPFPGAKVLQLGPLFIGYQDLGVAVVVLVTLAVVFAFFRFTKLGLAMRAASLYPESSQLVGVRISWMLALGWGLSSAVGAVGGIMVAPIASLDPNFMQPILLFAFAAAVLGGIESPVGAVVGGVIVGILLAVLGTYIPSGQDLRIPFGLVVIVAVLLLRPAGLFGRAEARRV